MIVQKIFVLNKNELLWFNDTATTLFNWDSLTSLVENGSGCYISLRLPVDSAIRIMVIQISCNSYETKFF